MSEFKVLAVLTPGDVERIGGLRSAAIVGRVTEYTPGPKYRAYTESGIMRLPLGLAALHRRELVKLPVEGSPQRSPKGALRTAWERFWRGDEDET